MYRELTPDDHRRMLRTHGDELPDVLLIAGLFNVHSGAERFAAYLDEAEYHNGIPHYKGKWRGRSVAVAAAFGGPMAALHVHSWCAAGVRAVVQLGFYGALQHGTQLGDVVVPRHAERQDGVSDWYLPKGILADSSPELSDAVSEAIESRGITVNRHAIYSTPALLAESREVIADWSRHGYHGVDMETAATFAVAKALGVQRAAALLRLDDLVSEEHSIADEMTRDTRRFIRDREREVVHAVLDAVTSLEPVSA